MIDANNDELNYRSCAYGRAMTGKGEYGYAAMRGRGTEDKEALACFDLFREKSMDVKKGERKLSHHNVFVF